MKDVYILGIETSCDETCAAVVKNGREIRSNAVFSQIDLHKRYGGVVPEIAARSHIEKMDAVLAEAMETAGISFKELDAVAVTNRPGLVGALLVGLSYAKGLAFAINRPLVAVDHIEGHIRANYLENPGFEPPYLCLVASGGHTHLLYEDGGGHSEIIGKTRDDAAGEAFDKVARMLGLPYPGGVEIDKLAAKGNLEAIRFPRAAFADGSLDFSFSGLKSAVGGYLSKYGNEGVNAADVAASFQEAVVSVLTDNAIAACAIKNCGTLALAGGVVANSRLRGRMAEACATKGLRLVIPPVAFCTDNGAMIASAGFFAYMRGERAELNVNAYPSGRNKND